MVNTKFENPVTDPAVAFGKKIRKLRLRLGYTLEDLAHRAGVHRSYVVLIEGGRANPSLRKIVALARALEVSPRNLL